ncbi:hypothetical protein D1872_285730 [compost metagenome]
MRRFPFKFFLDPFEIRSRTGGVAEPLQIVFQQSGKLPIIFHDIYFKHPVFSFYQTIHLSAL